MSDHIPTRELSALLDRGPGAAEAADHLDECAVCRRELELLRRMRMALSAMDDRDPPVGQWRRIEDGLVKRGILAGADADASPVREGAAGDGAGGGLLPEAVPGWLRVAAGVILFAGGVGLGVNMNAGPAGPAAGDTAAPPSADVASAPARTPASGPRSADRDTDREDYRTAMRQLEALRAGGPSPGEAFRNPEAAAEHLARLDALIRASREALADDPADPVVNEFLFQVVEERQALNRALHLSSLEYR